MKKALAAFTLIELTISIGIIALMSGVLLARYPDTAVRLNLVNLSHTIALSIREAQIRGSAVDSASGSIAGYGVFFSMASTTQFVLFGDGVTSQVKNGIYIGNGTYQTSPINETKTTNKLPSRYFVSKICIGTTFPFTCNSYGTPALTNLTISFIRPNPQPLIFVNNSTTTLYTGACVEVRSPRAPLTGHIRSIRVEGVGLITTSNTPCDNN